MAQLTLHLLGAPRVEVDGSPLVLDRRKALALLIYLALTPQSQRRDTLATLFWPDYDQATARGNLRRTLSLLHQALAQTWLEMDRENVALRRDNGFWLDVEAFQTLVANGDSHDHLPDEP